jgi:hypothetical protein
LAATAALALAAGIPIAVGTSSSPAHAAGISYDQLSKVQKRLLSGGSALALQDASSNPSSSSFDPTYMPRGNGDKGCQDNLSSNVKVNANCQNLSDPDLAGRGEANNETSIAYDPNNPQVMLASDNDYRRGDASCYTSYSGDGGRTWQDSTPPTSFTRGKVANVVDFGASREYWQGGGDTSVAFDTKGNAYLACQQFNRGAGTTSADISSAMVVYRSTQNGGASWNFPGRYVRVSNDVNGTGVPPFLDKELLTVDNHVGSPYQDRIYVSWTEFASDGSSFIYEAYSADYGEHFSAPHLVSVNNSNLCVQNFGAGTVATTGENSECNENQFSQPFTGPDGTLYVVYANFNNAVSAGIKDDGDDNGDGGDGAINDAAGTAPAAPADNRNQMLLSKSVDGGNTFLPPVKVSDYYDLPDCATYQAGQNFGRACVPEKGATANSVFRAVNYPSGAVDPTNPNKVVITFGSYINQHSNEANGCVPTGFNPADGLNLYTGVKTPGACNNDILISVSTDKGSTFTGTAADPRVMPVVTTDPGQATTDQWWQWIDFTKTGKLATSYYDRQYGTDETTGFSDVSLSGSNNTTDFGIVRVTSSSMPPPTQFGGVFFGDYTGLAAPNNANPIWMDTRTPELFLCPGTGAVGSPPQLCTASAPNAAVANDQEIRTANIPVPGK